MIKTEKWAIAKRSVCAFCPYLLFNENVTEGKVYEMIPETKQNGALICGGCGKVTLLEIMQDACGGFLPVAALTRVQ